jgi:rubrerythrin
MWAEVMVLMLDGMGYYATLPARLVEYIQDESKDSLYYQKLAGMASEPGDKALFMEFSRDEATHAMHFKQVYCQITGVEAPVGPVTAPEVPRYCEAIKARIMAESADFVKYGGEFLNAGDIELRNLFYMTGAEENRHGLRLTTLLCGIK